MEYAYVGSYTTPARGGLGSGGISVFSRTSPEERWREIQVVERVNPSFLAFGFNKTRLYCVQADGFYIAAYAIGPDGKLTLLNEKNVGSHNTVFLQTDNQNKHLVVTGIGCIVVIRLNCDGSLGDIESITIPKGKTGPLTVPQQGIKPHQTVFTPDYKFLIEPNKGYDEVHTFKLLENGELKLLYTVKCRPGSCPRHIAFHPNGKWAYLLTEFFGSVEAFFIKDGQLMPRAIYPTLPESFLGLKNSSAEIQVHPNGKFLYASNREHSSIVSYSINHDGLLKINEWTTEHINKPRFFMISEDGLELYCANEKGHDVSRFKINQSTGKLTYQDSDMKASAPACIVIKSNK